MATHIHAFWRRPFSMLGLRLFNLFRDPPSWAEFSSGVAVLAYGASFFGPGGRAPDQWGSLDILTDLLPDWWWPAITIIGALIQLMGLVLNVRFLRASAAFGMILWIALMVRFVWPVYPFSPLLMLAAAAISVPNILIVARHSREW